MKKGKKLGLILPGGGFHGPFQAGVLKRFEEIGIEFDYIIASSVGVINAVILGARNGNAEKLCQFWRTAHFYHFFYPAWKEFLTNRRFDSLCSSYLLKKKLMKLVDIQWQRDDRKVEISVLNLDTGRVEYISNDDLDFDEAIWAGIGMPPLAPAVYLKHKGHQYVDGGLARNYMIQRCFENGCDFVVLINIIETKKMKASLRVERGRQRNGKEVFLRTLNLVVKRVFADSSGGKKVDESKILRIYPPKGNYISLLIPSNLWFRRMIKMGYKEAQRALVASSFHRFFSDRSA